MHKFIYKTEARIYSLISIITVIPLSLIPGVFVVELDLPHDRSVVPVAEDNERQTVVDVSPQLGDLLRKILLLAVYHQECA